MTVEEISKGSRMERKKEETKQKIITASIKLFLTHGVAATTMEQIAEEVDIAKGTLYNYFPVKEAILDEHIKRSFREKNPARFLQLQELPDTRSRLILMIRMLLDGIQEQQEIFEKYLIYRVQTMISFKQNEDTKSGLHLLVAQVIQLGQKSGELRQDLPQYILEDLLEFCFIEIVKKFYLEPEKSKTTETIEQCVDLFLKGAGVEHSTSALKEEIKCPV